MKGLPYALSDYVPPSERREAPSPVRFETWRWFCGACTGMTLAQIEEASGVPFGTLLAWSMDDKIPEDVYIRVRDFPGEKRRLDHEK